MIECRTKRIAAVSTLAVLIATAIPAVAQTTIFVDASATGAGDGSSWADAFTAVQPALNAAQSGDQVWVAAGTYVENITLALDVGLYGGLAGTEDPATFNLADRDLAANETILDGNQNGTVVTAPAGATATTRIDGFTIRNGSRGVICASASPTIVNNTITGNSGGGVICGPGSPTIANNTITCNRSSHGGGIYAYDSSPTIANNTITCNGASEGGGICAFGSSPTITGNTITGNTASSGGAICAAYDSSPTIANTIVAFNSSGIYLEEGGTTILRRNCVYGNTAYNYSGLADPTGTDGNISVNPRLADVAFGNTHIQPDSPCVEAGDNAHAFGDYDVNGQLRVQPLGGTVDIGADESDGTVWAGGPYVIVRVAPDGNDDNDGSSWTLAKRTVQAGIDLASILGGEVWVQAGTYYERITLPPHVHLYGGFAGTENALAGRDWALNTTILDGQQGGSVVTASPGDQVSAIDGFAIRNGYGNHGTGTFPRGGGIYAYTSSPTIANNRITGNNASEGGGIYAYVSSATIANNTITSNSAHQGGGIYARYGSPTIANNTIMGNSAYYGGGGIHAGDSSSLTIANTILAFNSSGIYMTGSDTPIVRHNCVYGNKAYNYSGLADPTGTDGNISADPRPADIAFGNMHIQPDSPCVDAGDNAYGVGDADTDGQPRIQPPGGAVDIGADESDGTSWAAGPYVIVRVAPDGNDDNDGSSWAVAKRTAQAGIDLASSVGGEVWVEAGTYHERITLHPYVYLYGGFAGTESVPEARDWAVNTTVLDGQHGGSVVTIPAGEQVSAIDGFTICNGAGASLGGGIYSFGSPTIANNTVMGNSASNGGGIFTSHSSATIANNSIKGNTASYTCGGICVYSGSPTIANNTITGNSASLRGDGIYCDSSSPTIVNTIVAFNSSGIYKTGSGSPILRDNCVFGNTAYNYSGLADPTGAHGNLSADPLFVQTPDAGTDSVWGTPDDDPGNVHLLPGSPGIDAGYNADVFGDFDLDGLARIAWCTVDMGAHEYQGPFGDFFDDCDVDLQDYALLEVCLRFSGPDALPPFDECLEVFDFDLDFDVDLTDFAVFQLVFTQP